VILSVNDDAILQKPNQVFISVIMEECFLKKFLVIACLFLFLTACGGNADPSPEPTDYVLQDDDETAETPHQGEVGQQEVVFPTGEFDDPFEPFVDPDNLFELTDEQQALFDEYTRDFNFDVSIFQGVDPIDVAQVFFECGINGLWEGEYYLYYFEFEPLTKEELRIEAEHDIEIRDLRSRRSMADALFPNLNDGTFIDLGDGSGYIEFLSVHSDMIYVFEAMMRLHMRNVDDVWKINQFRFMELVDDGIYETGDEADAIDDEATDDEPDAADDEADAIDDEAQE